MVTWKYEDMGNNTKMNLRVFRSARAATLLEFHVPLKMSTLFSGLYLRNRSTFDIGVLGCIGIV